MQIVDWDLQNFNDNYGKFSATQSNYAVTKESYFAMCFRDKYDLYCGVTYQVERSFKWVRKITNAHQDSLAATKISSNNQEAILSTSMSPQPTENDSVVNVVYEPEGESQIVTFLSFNYLTGELVKMYKIHKGTSSELANTIIL